MLPNEVIEQKETGVVAPLSIGLKMATIVKGVVLILSLWLGSGFAFAAPPPMSVPVDSDNLMNQSTGPFSFLDGITRNSYFFGDLWGFRTMLSSVGMSLNVQEVSEVLGNTSGGIQQGFTYDGLTQAVLQLNTAHSFGLPGGLLNISGLNIHGLNLSAQNLGVLQTASGIEAEDAFRFWEIWYDQKFYDGEGVSRFDIKLGQQSLDQEFIVSSNALYFVNTMFGWPMVPSADMPGGGPAYPLSDLGVRLQWKPVNAIKILAGVFNGSPSAVSPSVDSQQEDPHGLSFPLNGGVLAIAEIQYSFPAVGDMSYSAKPALSGTYRLGFWYDTQSFSDQQYDDTGLSLNDPNTDGNAAQHSGDYSIYGVVDQMLWIDDKDLNRTLSFFARGMWAPADRNSVDFSVNAGFVLKDPLPYRTDDVFGIGMGYAHVSPALAGLAADYNSFNGVTGPTPSGETFVEGTYQYFVFPWFQLQPDVQYIFNPSGNALAVTGGGTAYSSVGNELVVGMRGILQL